MEHRPFPPNATKPPQTRVPWPLIALIIAAALLIAILWLSPRSNRAATKALNTNNQASQLVLSSIQLTPQTANNQTNVGVYGRATNATGQTITNAIVSATFHDEQGRSILVQQQPMQRVDAEGNERGAPAKELAEEPIEPGKTAGFRVTYTEVPAAWNHKPPDLSVLQVTVRK
jgi:hypothetical protein